MSDEPKRHPSRPSKRPTRHDARAEPDAVTLPPADEILTRPNQREQAAAPPSKRFGATELRSVRPSRSGASWQAPREAQATRSSGAPAHDPLSLRAEGGEGGGSLARQLAAVKQELAQTQHRLSRAQEERVEEAERFAELLARVQATEVAHRDSTERIARAEARATEAQEAAERLTVELQAAKDAQASAAARASAPDEAVRTLTAELEEERATSAWLRAAGEQATRENSELRSARKAEDEARAATERRVAEELVVAERALEAAEGEATRLRASEATAREGLDRAVARASAIEQAQRSVAEELEAARAALRDSGLRLATLQAERDAAKADTEKALAKALAEHEALMTRARSEHERREAEAARAADERLLAATAEQSKLVTAMSAVKAERSAMAAAVELADGRLRAVGEQITSTTELLAILNRSLETLETAEEQIGRLRAEATTARRTIADQTLALRLVLSRAADAGAGPSDDGAPVLEVAETDVSESDLVEDEPSERR